MVISRLQGKQNKTVRLVVIGFCFLFFVSCNRQKKGNNDPSECITQILRADDSLGKIRNHECETKTLTKTIKNYAGRLSSLDFSQCPDTFSKAFKGHIKAWNEMLVVVKSHDTLRGEMHDLFDQIAISKDSIIFKEKLNAIWSTWSEVEKSKESGI